MLKKTAILRTLQVALLVSSAIGISKSGPARSLSACAACVTSTSCQTVDSGITACTNDTSCRATDAACCGTGCPGS